MNYFINYPVVRYKFGDETQISIFNNIAKYSDLVDQIKDQVTAYEYYTIQDGDRPDTVSYKLYGTTRYHWSFYLLNDHIRESGWPLTSNEITPQLQKNFPDWALQTANKDWDGVKLNGAVDDKNIGAIFRVGREVRGETADVGDPTFHVGTIVDRNIDIGQFIIKTTDTVPFQEDRYLAYEDEQDGITYYLRIISFTEEYNGTHHFENSAGDWVDVDPFEMTSINVSGLTRKTFKDMFIAKNDELKEIKVFRKDVIKRVASEYFKSLRT